MPNTSRQSQAKLTSRFRWRSYLLQIGITFFSSFQGAKALGVSTENALYLTIVPVLTVMKAFDSEPHEMTTQQQPTDAAQPATTRPDGTEPTLKLPPQ